MSSPTEAIREQLMATNQEFQRLQEQHTRYEARLDELASKHYLTEKEQMEEVRLKKLKLRAKDQMQMLVHRAQAA